MKLKENGKLRDPFSLLFIYMQIIKNMFQRTGIPLSFNKKKIKKEKLKQRYLDFCLVSSISSK
jgi:hypothetical protein